MWRRGDLFCGTVDASSVGVYFFFFLVRCDSHPPPPLPSSSPTPSFPSPLPLTLPPLPPLPLLPPPSSSPTLPLPSPSPSNNRYRQVFRRWDGQATLIANNIMARKAIRNQWRSGPFLHHTALSVSVDTPTEKLDLMKAGIAAGMRVSWEQAGRKGVQSYNAWPSSYERGRVWGKGEGAG